MGGLRHSTHFEHCATQGGLEPSAPNRIKYPFKQSDVVLLVVVRFFFLFTFRMRRFLHVYGHAQVYGSLLLILIPQGSGRFGYDHGYCYDSHLLIPFAKYGDFIMFTVMLHFFFLLPPSE